MPAIQVPTKNRRRPAWALAGVAFVLATMAVGWAVFQANSTTVSVIAVRTTISRGQIISADELVSVEAKPDPALHPIAAADVATVVGKRAGTDLPAGTLLPAGSVTTELVPAKNQSIVGVLVKAGAAPVTGLTEGAVVRLVPLPASAGSSTAPNVTVSDGTVIAVSASPDGAGTQVDVDVANNEAATMQRLAAQGQLALVVDSQEH